MSSDEGKENQPKRRSDLVRGIALTGGIILIIVVGQVAISGVTEGYCIVWPAIGTAFAPGYSEKAFGKIKPGMTESEVLNLLGPPFRSTDGRPDPHTQAQWQPRDRTWTYSQDSSARGGDWAWLSRQVIFRDGRVTQTVSWVYHD
jgi:hypothetical protein